jgi:CheY-like chemotaxis protein
VPETEAKSEASEDDGKALENFRILVVDDTKLNHKLLIRLLAGKGLACDEAENGLIAVDMVEKALKEGNPYDTILLDFEMPVMKGPEAAKKICGFGCSSFIVGVTGNLLREDIESFKQHGVNCVLPKPLNLSDLEGRWIEQGISFPYDNDKNAPILRA